MKLSNRYSNEKAGAANLTIEYTVIVILRNGFLNFFIT